MWRDLRSTTLTVLDSRSEQGAEQTTNRILKQEVNELGCSHGEVEYSERLENKRIDAREPTGSPSHTQRRSCLENSHTGTSGHQVRLLEERGSQSTKLAGHQHEFAHGQSLRLVPPQFGNGTLGRMS